MRRYNIKIDGEVMPNSYSYEELLLNDIFDFDDIEVKQVSKSNWTNIKSFYFPEEHDEDQPQSESYYVGEDGQVHFKGQKAADKTQQEYTIDEFGQVVSRNNIGGGANNNTSSRTNSSTSSSSSSTSSSSSSSDGNGWKIFFTIVAIIVFIIITCTTGWGSIPAGIVGYWILKTIWGDDL